MLSFLSIVAVRVATLMHLPRVRWVDFVTLNFDFLTVQFSVCNTSWSQRCREIKSSVNGYDMSHEASWPRHSFLSSNSLFAKTSTIKYVLQQVEMGRTICACCYNLFSILPVLSWTTFVLDGVYTKFNFVCHKAISFLNYTSRIPMPHTEWHMSRGQLVWHLELCLGQISKVNSQQFSRLDSKRRCLM